MTRYSESSRRVGPYRSRSGLIFGVCKGLANYFDFSVFWMRVIFVALFVFTAGWGIVLAYVVLALLMKPEPVLPLETDEDVDFYNSYTSSRSAALRRLKRTYDNLERRIERMESIVTARSYDWERRLNG